ncbi:MAG: aminotransferase class V-fold PLP-dependent enzyme [Candidatus Odyssella sp.]|nr:aminotransferase class V-fold PLP-dependent enzyme [Candidatus Odyssella sp.]
MGGEPVYLDYNATAPVRPEAAAAVAEALAATGNPSSVHRFGRAARRRVEDAREQVAALIGAAPAEIVFTGGGTEANALALAGAGRARILVSAIEHDSVLAPAVALDPETPRIPAASDGTVDLDALDRLLAGRGAETIVSLMLANNETGVIQPVAEAARRAHAAGALLHCDAIQAAGKIPVDVRALGADLVSLSAHKLGGPQGVGALRVADRIALRPMLRGGGQERGRRAGTENVPGIAGFGAAAAAARRDLGDAARIAALRDALEAAVLARAARARIAGADSARLPNTSCIVLPGVASETQVMALDLAGVAVSAGAACSSGKVKESHVLAAMGFAADEAGAAIRASLGWASTPADVDRFVAAWSAMAARRAAA